MVARHMGGAGEVQRVLEPFLGGGTGENEHAEGTRAPQAVAMHGKAK
jgi:hypothetical protein